MEPVESLIRVVRGQRVILDADLARVYGVTTKALNQAVRRNAHRFPSDFMFPLAAEEVVNLRSQSVTSSSRVMRSQIVTASDDAKGLPTGTASKRNVRFLPNAFTEHGAIMAANVLRSQRAVQMSVFVVRAFVKMRATLATHRDLAQKLAELESSLTRRLDRHDLVITRILQELRQLMNPPAPARRRIGFHVRERRAVYRTDTARGPNSTTKH